jgi:hypothetical protein
LWRSCDPSIATRSVEGWSRNRRIATPRTKTYPWGPRWQWSSFRHYQTGVRGTMEIESDWTARQRGWQLPEWMRDPRAVSSISPVASGGRKSASPVPPPRRTRDRGHPRLDKVSCEIGPPGQLVSCRLRNPSRESLSAVSGASVTQPVKIARFRAGRFG